MKKSKPSMINDSTDIRINSSGNRYYSNHGNVG